MIEPDRKLILELRKETCLPMLEIKFALIEANNDKEKALKILKDNNPIKYKMVDYRYA